MASGIHHHTGSDRALERAVRYAVLPEIARRRPERILLISPEPAEFRALSGWNVVMLHPASEPGDDPVACDMSAMPFVDDSFDVVLLHHVTVDGQEPELREARRVLGVGGDLFVLGQGSLGWRARFSRRGAGRPGVRVLALCQQLRRRAFVLEQCAACGLLGVPVYWEQFWQRPGLPFADTVVIHGRHRPLEPIVRPLRFGQPSAAALRSAAAENLFRKCV